MMTSHEYALKVKEAADYLLSRPDFELATSHPRLYLGWYYQDKDKFLTAVKALGAGEKNYTASDLEYAVTQGAEMQITINRASVCRKVQDEKWECEPLLSSDEERRLNDVIGECVDTVDRAMEPSPIMSDNDIPF